MEDALQLVWCSGIEYIDSKEGTEFSHLAIRKGHMLFFLIFACTCRNAQGIDFPTEVVCSAEETSKVSSIKELCSLGVSKLSTDSFLAVGKSILMQFQPYTTVYYHCTEFLKKFLQSVLEGEPKDDVISNTITLFDGFLFRFPISEQFAKTVLHFHANLETLAQSEKEFINICVHAIRLSHPEYLKTSGWKCTMM